MSAGTATQIEDMCPAELHQRKDLVDLIVRRIQIALPETYRDIISVQKSSFSNHSDIEFQPHSKPHLKMGVQDQWEAVG